MLHAQDNEPIPVYVLQGDGVATPLAGRYIDSVGVVTGVGPAGFYLQDPAGDHRDETSDGVYVYTRTRPTVQVGDCVVVRGALIDEFYEKTELSRVKAIEPSSLCRTTTPAPVTLPTFRYDMSPTARYEALEGMRVSLPRLEGVVHGPTKRYASGEAEFALAPTAAQLAATQLATPKCVLVMWWSMTTRGMAACLSGSKTAPIRSGLDISRQTIRS